MVFTMANTTPHSADTKMENAMEDVLAKTLSNPQNNSSNGGNTTAYNSAKSAFSRTVYDSNDQLRHLRPDYRRRILVRGSQYDFAI